MCRIMLYLFILAPFLTRGDVIIPVPHLSQQTPVWCWVAAAQQIVAFQRGLNHTPAQCVMVEASGGLPPGTCCVSANPVCVHAGNFVAVSNLISYYGGAISSYVLPSNPSVIYATLQQGRPILAQLASGGGNTHVVVIRGMMLNPSPLLIVNDPLQPNPIIIPFDNLAGVWMDGLVIN